MLNSILKKLTILSILSLLFVFAPIATGSNDAVAQDADVNALTGTMCRAFQLATGTAGKTFAAFAIISMGLGFFTGKVSWGLMIGVMAGIAAIFGAPTMVSAIGGEKAMDCEATVKGSACVGSGGEWKNDICTCEKDKKLENNRCE
jgi:type IV secretory pathway VirB2 component (pilin)